MSLIQIEIDGVGRVEVDDSFLKASPAVQQLTMAEIAGSLGKSRPRYPQSQAPQSQVPKPQYSGHDAPSTYQGMERAISKAFPGAVYTSEQRTPEKQRQLIDEWERGGRKGVRPADNSYHLSGHALDIAKMPGVTIDDIKSRSGLNFAEALDEGDHYHVAATEVPEQYLSSPPEVQKPPPSQKAFLQEAQRRFDAGASREELAALAQENGGYSLEGLDEALSYRDKGGKGASFVQGPETAPASPDAPSTPATPDQTPDGEGPGVISRHLAAANEGLADVLGAPVDLMNGGLGLVGLPTSDKPFLGSESIRDGMHALGIGQANQSYIAKSALEKYTQAAARGVGQSVIPGLGMEALAGRTALRTLPMAARLAVTEGASGAGSGIGGQTARDVAPGNPWAEFGGSLVGGGIGGALGHVGPTTAAKALEKLKQGPSGRFVDKLLPELAAKRFAKAQAGNPHSAIDAELSSAVRRMVDSIPTRDAGGRSIPKAQSQAILQERIGQYEASLLPRTDVASLDLPPSVKRQLTRALEDRHILSPGDITRLRTLPHGEAVADAIEKARRLRSLVPEPASGRSGRGIPGLAIDTAGAALGSAAFGPMGAAASRLVSRAVDVGAIGGSAKASTRAAQALAKLDGKFTIFAPGASRATISGRSLSNAAATSQDLAYLARKASTTAKAKETLETFRLEAEGKRISVRNDRDNVRPGGGFRGYLHEHTGLMPQEQDAAALSLMNDGIISPDQFKLFLADPGKLMNGKAGLAITDRLKALAVAGKFPRDPSWSPPAPPSAAVEAGGVTIRNPLAYRATAEGNQERVSNAIASVRDRGDLDAGVRETLATALSKLGSVSDRLIAERIVRGAVEKVPEALRAEARSILNPIAGQVK